VLTARRCACSKRCACSEPFRHTRRKQASSSNMWSSQSVTYADYFEKRVSLGVLVALDHIESLWLVFALLRLVVWPAKCGRRHVSADLTMHV
jgi:hypothetical protein